MIDRHRDILEEIVSLHGDCLHWSRCGECPFKTKCLPEFVKAEGRRLSKHERANLAADVLAREELLGEDDAASEQYNISS